MFRWRLWQSRELTFGFGDRARLRDPRGDSQSFEALRCWDAFSAVEARARAFAQRTERWLPCFSCARRARYTVFFSYYTIANHRACARRFDLGLENNLL